MTRHFFAIALDCSLNIAAAVAFGRPHQRSPFGSASMP